MASLKYNEVINVNRNLEGDRHDNVDNVRIFNFALTLEDIIRLPAIQTAPADLNGDGIVDQTDKDIVQANIGPEKL